MAVPKLSPRSKTSAIVLPSTGSTADVHDALPYAAYSGSVDFITGAVKQGSYTYRKL